MTGIGSAGQAEMQAGFLVDGAYTCAVSVTDRGLAYGDGVFETMLVAGEHWVLWQQHLDRLNEGIKRLNLPYVVNEGLSDRVETLIAHYREDCGIQAKGKGVTGAEDYCIVKIIITRGSASRGYSPRGCTQATEILACYPLIPLDQRLYRHGIEVRLLASCASTNAQLAGIKHLNRLEQVVASAELSACEFEGIMCDARGFLIEGTKSNIILKQQGRWLTPRLKSSGVHGVMRKYLLECDRHLGFSIVEKDIRRTECASVQAMAMVNSVSGIVPVRKIESFELDIDCVIEEIQKPIHQIFRIGTV